MKIYIGVIRSNILLSSTSNHVSVSGQGMLSRWSRVISLCSRAGLGERLSRNKSAFPLLRNYSKGVERATLDKDFNSFSRKDRHGAELDRNDTGSSFQVSGNMAFMSKPRSLALPPNSTLSVQEPEFKGFYRFILRLLLYYSKESRYIRTTEVLYKRIVYQVDRPEIYDTFSLEKCFRTTYALLVLHMWLCLSRLKAEGKEGIEFGQYLYEVYNHDVEIRVAAAGVNLLLTTWMKDLEKIFYGNVAAYDAAILPEAAKDELSHVIWRNVFSDEDAPMPKGTAATAVQALARYTRREYACLTLTDKEALFSGNIMFSSVGKCSIQS